VQDHFLHKFFRHDLEAYGDFTLDVPCCSEFVVSAERVRRRPRQLYCEYLDFVETYRGTPDKLKGQSLEWFAPLIFGMYD